MLAKQFNTPVIFIIFNRPDTTQKVFEAIRQIKPTKLLIIADGARPNKPSELDKCQAARSIIDTKVDWDCEIITNYSDINLGCKQRISSGLDWAFELVEEAIILEDDCLPNFSFFHFCQELLEKYREDKRIFHISGNNFQFGRKRTEDSYYFSIYNHCWGWATWRRAWQHYDIDMQLWPQIRDERWLQDILINPFAVRYWQKKFQDVYDNKIDSWAIRLTLSCWLQSGLTILPNVNLVSNIGFDLSGTHHQYNRSPLANIPTQKINFPLQHPSFLVRNKVADDFTQKFMFGFQARTIRKAQELLRI
jgi:hypothetical protein